MGWKPQALVHFYWDPTVGMGLASSRRVQFRKKWEKEVPVQGVSSSVPHDTSWLNMGHPGQVGQAVSPVPDQGIILMWHFLLVPPLSCQESDGHISGQRCAVSAGKVAGGFWKKGLWLALREPRAPVTSIWPHLLPDPGPRIRETHDSYVREPHTETHRRVDRTFWWDSVFTLISMADALPSAGSWFECERHDSSSLPRALTYMHVLWYCMSTWLCHRVPTTFSHTLFWVSPWWCFSDEIII